MKRLNPTTNSPFKLGDVCPDVTSSVMYFYNYRSDVLSDGFRGERWLYQEAFDRALARDKAAKEKKRRQAGKQVRMFKVIPMHV